MIIYNFNQIQNFLSDYKDLLLSNSVIQHFKQIKKDNVFNPNKFIKKFNYTNWRNSVSKEDETNKNIDDINCEKISLLLNKISNKTFDNLYNKLISIIDTNDTYLDFTIERLFNFATEQYLLTKLYSRICLNLNSKYGTNVKKTILEKCKMYYRNYNNNKKSVENDTLSVEDKQIKLTKLKYKFIGIFHFVGELYKNSLIDTIVIWKYLNLLFENLNDDTIREQYIECLKQLLIKIGDKIIEVEPTLFQTNVLQKIDFYITNKKQYSFTNREFFMFMDIKDLFKKS